MPKARKADRFAGRGSFADALKQRRKAIELGDPQKASQAFRQTLKARRKKR